MLGNLTELLLLLVSIPSDLGGGRVKKYRTSPILGLVLREEEHAPEALVLVLLFELDIAKARAIGYYGKGGLPKLFIEKKYIDEVEEIQKLHDDKKLEKLLDCCERIDDIEGDDGGFEACRDINFVPCETCYGSCKIYYEGDYEEDVLIAMKMA
ncbi:hypothetical protein MTR_7g078370 [Medicago truncatula]|uniref:Thioredoxin-like protein n=1 Tax=Medicago truncatula TaxID=3880 RepID=G7L5R0_MEDTR|nr:hypothetical protein MTR_7g078370 [Medicago truncatula]